MTDQPPAEDIATSLPQATGSDSRPPEPPLDNNNNNNPPANDANFGGYRFLPQGLFPQPIPIADPVNNNINADDPAAAINNAAANTGLPADPAPQQPNPNNNNAENTNPQQQQQQQRVHRIHIRAPRGGSLRLNVGGRTVSINPNQANNHPMHHPHHRTPPPVRLPPLLPRPLPDAQQDFRDEDEDAVSTTPSEQEELDRFKCAICLEYMRDPCGCGNCRSRFCYSCLARVATNAPTNHNMGMPPNNATTTARCPTCRAEFDIEDIQRDRDIHHRIRLAKPIPCRFVGCSALIPIDQVAVHEVHCPFVKLHCRYKAFGCYWIGTRANLSNHEANECALAKVSTLVNRHRQLQADVSQRLELFGQNVAASTAMLEAQRIRQLHVHSPSNPIHLVQLIVLVTCTTPQFLLTKENWIHLHVTANARAAVFNFVSMVPTALLIIQMIINSYQQILSYELQPQQDQHYQYQQQQQQQVDNHVFENNNNSSNSSSMFSYDNDTCSSEAANITTTSEYVAHAAEPVDEVETILAFVNMTCLAFITAVCFFMDGRSSLQWEFFRIPGTTITQRIILHTIAMALLASHALAMHFSGTVLRAMLVWSFICVTSVVFPTIVVTILEAANGIHSSNISLQQSNTKILSSGRVARPLLFALRFAPLICTFGIGSCIEAAILVYLARQKYLRTTWSNLISLDNEMFLSNTPVNRLYAVLGVRAAIRSFEFYQTGTIVLDSILVIVLLMTTNFALIQFAWAGIQMGSKIASASRMELMATTTNTNGVPMLRKDYNGIGMAAFSFWVVFLSAIPISY